MATTETSSRGGSTRTSSNKVRVWSEVTVRISAGNEYDFVRYTHGAEAVCANTPRATARVERELHALILATVETRASEFLELVSEIGK